MHNITDNISDSVRRNGAGIQWGLIERLEDIDFADDLCLITYARKNIEEFNTDGNKMRTKINKIKWVSRRVIEQAEQFQSDYKKRWD